MNTEHTNQSGQAEPASHSPIDLQSIPERQRGFTAENIRDIARACMRIGDNEQVAVVFAIADALRDGNLIIQPPAVAARIRELEEQLNAATHARQEAQQIAQEAIEARNRAGVEIRRPLLKRIRELQAQRGELLSWMAHIQGAALDMSTPRQAIHLATVNAIAAAERAQKAEPVARDVLMAAMREAVAECAEICDVYSAYSGARCASEIRHPVMEGKLADIADRYAAQLPVVATPDAAVGKLRILLAACNRIESGAEEFESQDGVEMAIAIDCWLEFLDALEAARAVLAAAQEGGA